MDQGGGKRKGAFAIYLEPWHSDIFDWLDLRKNHGKEEARCRDLFYGLWVNDLFMQVLAASRHFSLCRCVVLDGVRPCSILCSDTRSWCLLWLARMW